MSNQNMTESKKIREKFKIYYKNIITNTLTTAKYEVHAKDDKIYEKFKSQQNQNLTARKIKNTINDK